MRSRFQHASIHLVLFCCFIQSGMGEERASSNDVYSLDPAGLPGTLVLSGEHCSSESLAKVIKNQLSDRHPRLLCVHDRVASPFAEVIASLRKNDDNGLNILTVETSNWENALTPELLTFTQGAVVWIYSDRAPALGKDLVEHVRHSVLRNNGTLIVSGNAIHSFCDTNESEDSDEPTAERIVLLEDLLIELSQSEDANPNTEVIPGMVTLRIPDEGGIAIHRRRIFSLPDAPASEAIVDASEQRDALHWTISRRQPADLTALRRAAWDRTHKKFPPDKLATPHVASGSLLIVGGGGFTKEMVDLFIEKAGGKEAKIVIVPTADENPRLEDRSDVRMFLSAGAKSVEVLHTTDREVANSEEFLAPLKDASGVWFGGGRQWRTVDAYEGTAFVDECHRVLERGGIIAGSSAGATIQGEYLVRGHPVGNHIMMAQGYERGFGFLPGAAIDQHFTQRNRQADLESVKKTLPQLFCIGIDETTAILVEEHFATVLGKHSVSFYNNEWMEGSPPVTGKTGSVYDFRTNQMLKTHSHPEQEERSECAVTP